MIKSNELRVGNWINYLGDNMKFNEIGLSNLFNPDNDIYGTDFEPIKLTEEILLKIKGVSKTSKTWYELKYSDITFRIEDGNWDEPSLDILKGGVYITCVEYLHELQNVIYWFLREEIEL